MEKVFKVRKGKLFGGMLVYKMLTFLVQWLITGLFTGQWTWALGLTIAVWSANLVVYFLFHSVFLKKVKLVEKYYVEEFGDGSKPL